MSSIFNAHVHVRIIARLPQEIDVEQILGGGDRGGLTGISKTAEEEMMKKEVFFFSISPSPSLCFPSLPSLLFIRFIYLFIYFFSKKVWGASNRSDGAVFTALNDVR